jgi:hypothetical protein
MDIFFLGKAEKTHVAVDRRRFLFSNAKRLSEIGEKWLDEWVKWSKVVGKWNEVVKIKGSPKPPK